MTANLRGIAPIHPGEILAEEIIPGCNLSKSEFARRLGMSREALYNILNGKTGISSLMALKLSKMLGTTPEFWLNLQRNYDLATVSKAKAAEIDNVQALAAA